MGFHRIFFIVCFELNIAMNFLSKFVKFILVKFCKEVLINEKWTYRVVLSGMDRMTKFYFLFVWNYIKFWVKNALLKRRVNQFHRPWIFNLDFSDYTPSSKAGLDSQFWTFFAYFVSKSTLHFICSKLSITWILIYKVIVTDNEIVPTFTKSEFHREAPFSFLSHIKF